MSSSPRYTLGHFFSLHQGKEVEAHLQLSGVESAARMRELARGLPWAAVFSAMAGKIAELLRIDVVELIPAAWKKSATIYHLLVKSSQSPGETYLTQLAGHTLSSSHHPALEIYLEGQLIHRLLLEVTVEIEIESAILEIADGRIREARLGTVKGRGAIALEGVTIVQQETKTLELPGRIRFSTEPQPLPQPPVAAAGPDKASLSRISLR